MNSCKCSRPQFEQELKEGRTKQSILGQVKWVLKRLLAGSRPDLSMVAKELGMSERTLQRRITEEGTTFRQLLNETRHELVRQYLGVYSIQLFVGRISTTKLAAAPRHLVGQIFSPAADCVCN